MSDTQEAELPDSYDPDSIEPKWRRQWLDDGVYEYRGASETPREAGDGEARSASSRASGQRPRAEAGDSGATDYVVDTPPPYPTGNLHIGHGLNWCYMDFLARYHRLQGDDVLFPQGWDCHGLPTEVKVEETRDIHRTDVSREQFREWCVEHTETEIDAMKETMRTLGFSQDWSAEYRTMDAGYWAKTQRSFVEMADEDYVYRDEHPVNWCPRCQTAIADAEVETIQREGTLYTITFPGTAERSSASSRTESDDADNDDIDIATTRPELLAACVAIAVHPDDERYQDRVGDTFEVPIFGQEIELVADDAVDEEFGTGAVMICTFGDKQDVEWWAEYDLELRQAFTESGRLSPLAGEFEGMAIADAKDAIPERLDDEGLLVDSEPTEQSVGACWRCDTPIEILSKEQWFVEVRKDEILEHARDVEWVPDHMYDRLEDWTEGMDWDWVISRQRVFATPIPAWFCGECGHVHLASIDELPVDPTDEQPAVEACPECGSSDWEGETDVMDTWMDSSISAMHVAGWPDEEFEPVQLRPQGHDIIRTWAFYTLLRTAALEEERPWDTVLINGMVFGEDGNKMSKSRGNVVSPEEVVEEYSADAFRQAIALGGQPGSDVQFQWKEVTSASRFLTKTWNVFRFGTEHFDGHTPDVTDPAYRDADRWILSKLSRTIAEVRAEMDDYRFDAALRTLREFVWDDLADDYVELVKGRLYSGPPGERNAARHTLYTAVSAVVRMLAPFSPYVTEEMWSHLPGTDGSVHNAEWPELDMVDDDAEYAGDIVADVASEVRAWKSDQGMALNAELDRVEVYLDADGDRGDWNPRALDTYDLSETINAPTRVEVGEPNVELAPVGVDPDHAAIGPEFRDRAGDVVAALEAGDPVEFDAQLRREGEITLDLDGDAVTVAPEMVDVVEEYRAESGEAVAVLETERATVLVFP